MVTSSSSNWSARLVLQANNVGTRRCKGDSNMIHSKVLYLLYLAEAKG